MNGLNIGLIFLNKLQGSITNNSKLVCHFGFSFNKYIEKTLLHAAPASELHLRFSNLKISLVLVYI